MARVPDTMTEQEIIEEITAITSIADDRFNDLCDNAPALAGLVHRHQMMEPEESARMHDLKMALTEQFGHLHTPQAAHERIMQRRAMRKLQRELS